MRERVKFYGKGNWASSFYFERIKIVVTKFLMNSHESKINDILEYYSIDKFIEAGIESSLWDEDFILKYRKFGKLSKGVIGNYFSRINDMNATGLFEDIDTSYYEEFWECFERFKSYQNVSSSTFNMMICSRNILVEDILHRKKIVGYYGENIKEYFMANTQFAKILLSKYVLYNFGRAKEIFLPSEMTLDDKEKIILEYIESEEVHINYLEAIVNIKSKSDFRISTRTKYKAQVRIEKEKKKLFENSTGMKYGTYITFSQTQNEEKTFDLDGTELHLSFSTKWIEENKDNATLLNNFIYLFEYADMQMRICFVSKESELGILERTLFVKSITDYPIGVAFKQKNGMILIEMVSYYKELQRQDIYLEDIIEWFFKEYLKDEFGVDGFNIKLSRSNTYLDKCRTVFPEMESVLKQYKLYVEDGEINKELLQISSDSLNYDSIPSYIPNKYVYGKGEDYIIAKYLLTSDQSMLSYIERIGDGYDNFFKLLTNEDIYANDYDDIHSADIEWLCVHQLIYIDSNGQIKWKEYDKVLIIVDLAKNDVLSYWHLTKGLRNTVEKLHELNILEFRSGLFSIPEQNYISFILNQNKYGNGYDIRNKCLHGSQADSEFGSEIHEQYYLYGLVIFIMAIIKINDEFCLRDVIKQENE